MSNSLEPRPDHAFCEIVWLAGLQLRERTGFLFYFSTKTYADGTQKNRLNETVLLSTQNPCLN